MTLYTPPTLHIFCSIDVVVFLFLYCLLHMQHLHRTAFSSNSRNQFILSTFNETRSVSSNILAYFGLVSSLSLLLLSFFCCFRYCCYDFYSNALVVVVIFVVVVVVILHIVLVAKPLHLISVPYSRERSTWKALPQYIARWHEN